MQATTAAPSGANLLAATEPGMSALTSGIVGNSGNALQTFYANPNSVLTSASNYAQLADLQNRAANQQLNPLAANLKQQTLNNQQAQYNNQVAYANQTGPGSAQQQIENSALRSGLGQIFNGGGNTAGSFGQAQAQQALGQGVLGANQYQQNVLNSANSNANGLVAANYGQYTPSGSSLENMDLTQQQNFVGNQNAATQNLLNNQMGQVNAFQGTVNNAANQLQSTENQNVAAQNQASAGNMGALGSALATAAAIGGVALMAA
jgi:hypothetical protein